MVEKNIRFSEKHPEGTSVAPKILESIQEQAKEGGLPCAVAFELASRLGVAPPEVGLGADLLEMPITKCQLGLFGYGEKKKIAKPAETVEPSLDRAIRERLKAGRLACVDAWAIADQLGIRKMTVSSACEALGIKIKPCQLGAF